MACVGIQRTSTANRYGNKVVAWPCQSDTMVGENTLPGKSLSYCSTLREPPLTKKMINAVPTALLGREARRVSCTLVI